MIRFRWYNTEKTDPRSVLFGWSLSGTKLNGFRGPYTWTLDIYLRKRILVILIGRRY